MRWFPVILLSLFVSVNASAIRKDLSEKESSEMNEALWAIPEINNIRNNLHDTSYIVMLPLDINLHCEPMKDCVYIRIERRGYKSSNPVRPYAPSKYWDAYFVKYDRINKKVALIIKE